MSQDNGAPWPPTFYFNGVATCFSEPGSPTWLGSVKLVVQTADSYQALLNRLELYESAASVTRGLQDIAEGGSSTLDEFDSRMRSKRGKKSR